MEMDGHIGRQGYAAFRLLPYITRFDKEELQRLLQTRHDEDSEDDDDDYFDDQDMTLSNKRLFIKTNPTNCIRD